MGDKSMHGEDDHYLMKELYSLIERDSSIFEFLPGSVKAAGIPVQTRMMTISDIFDALTASDRPYKRAVPVDRAIDILGFEVKDGMLDQDLLKLFVDAKVFETELGG